MHWVNEICYDSTNMMRTQTYSHVTWTDLINPTPEEIRAIMDDHGISPLVANELLTHTVRPKVDFYTDHIYLILHIPSSPDSQEYREIDFIIGKKFIITTHYESIDALHDFAKMFEVNSILDHSDMGKNAGFVFFYMIKHLYNNLQQHIEEIGARLHHIEAQIFQDNERAMVSELSKINRSLLTYRNAISLHESVLESLESVGKRYFGEEYAHYTRSIIGEYYKVRSGLDRHREYLDELRKTNDSLLSSKQNDVMTRLTMMALFTFPLSLIAAIFSMRTDETPLLGHPYDFEIVISIMICLTILMFTFFKKKRWL